MRHSIVLLQICALLMLCNWPAHVIAAEPRVPTAQEAPIALLVDITSGQVLHAREPERRFVPASITKVMTLYTAFELMAQGQLNPTQTFTMSPQTHAQWYRKGSTMFLGAEEEVSVDTLLRGISTVSANDASVVLAENAAGSVENWLALMNEKARAIGMRGSHFGTPNGWPDEGRTFVTARDLAVLAEQMIDKHQIKYARYFGNRGFRHGGYAQVNHDPLTGRLAGADGIKTGFTREAGHGFLGSAERDGRRLVMVVAATRSGRERARIARAYMEWGFAHFRSRKLFGAGEEVGRARVQAGSQSSVGLKAAKGVHISLPQGTDPQTRLIIRYNGPLRAPIAAGQKVAELELRVDGMPTSSLPLLAAETVDVAGPFQRIWAGITGWFA